MTQQPSKTALSPTPTAYSRPVRVLVVGLFAIMAFGLGNIIHSVDTRLNEFRAWHFTSRRKEPVTMLTDEEFRGFLKILGSRIRTIRKDKNLTMRDIMISSSYYDAQWRKCEGGGSLTLESLLKVALALDVSLAELFGDLEQWPRKSVGEIVEANRTMPVQAAIAK